MTSRRRRAAHGEPLSRTFHDIAQDLESAEDSDVRVIRVLERLRLVVPYQQCAVLEALPGRERRLVTLPDTSPVERASLAATIGALLTEFLADQRRATEANPTGRAHLAIPMIGLDEVVGVLFVRGGSAYEEHDVRWLSVVAAKLAAYFSMLQASALEAERTRQLHEARQAAERANRAKDEFLALISHELRSPLNTILGWADALRAKETCEADRTRAFDAIERSVRAQAKLIKDLLDLACVSNATLRLDLRAVEPAKLIEATVRAFRPRAAEKSIRLEVALDESGMPLVADPNRLQQILAHLVTNAIDFTHKGGRVEVRLERAGMLARIRVIDDGTGIDPELMPHIFERFRQADSSGTRAHGGLGVGLALVKDLVELHRGRVHAESAGHAKGAIFTVELPLAAAPAGSGASSPGQALFDGLVLAGIEVLVVDDDKDICEVLQFVLERQGAVVTVAASVAEALAALERSMPDVIVSDIAMPGETGHDLMRHIVARAGCDAPPAAALSSFTRAQDVERALASGFRMQLAKPVDPQALVAAVAALARSKGAIGRDHIERKAP